MNQKFTDTEKEKERVSQRFCQGGAPWIWGKQKQFDSCEKASNTSNDSI